MKDALTSYKQIEKYLKTPAILQSIFNLVHWDQETRMPKKGLELKSEQSKLLSELVHKQKTSNRYKKLLEELIDLSSGKIKAKDLPNNLSASLKEMRRDFLKETKLPSSYVKKFTQTTINSLDAWKRAKDENNFKIFSPHLKKVVTLLQKKVKLLGYKDHPYNALLDLYEPKMTVKKLDELFLPLKKELVSLLHKIQNKTNRVPMSTLKGTYPIPEQVKLCDQVVEQMQISKDYFDLSETAHPFCLALSPDDIRITTHFDEHNFLKAFLATVHEGGHGLYEHHLPKKYSGTPLGEAASYGIHESQSRIWETCIGQSSPFWQFFYPKVKEIFPKSLEEISPGKFYQAVNYVEPSLIRIYADEVTYNLHIILRYEIEKGLIDGSIQVKDLPKLWNTKMQESFGLTPKNYSEGILQDIHWSLGYIGYFPSYCLGSLYAGALFIKLIKTHPNWEKRIASGEFTFVNKFLKEKIHIHGREYEPVKLIENAIEEPFTIKPYITYLTNKYT